MKYRTKFIDYDARPNPKTDIWCICCQRDLKPGTARRYVKIVDFPDAVHPDDYSLPTEPLATYPIGMDCAKRLGLEWTTEAP